MIKGFDVSSWQNDPKTPQKIDWSKAKGQESKFCFIRAAYAEVEDVDLDYNWQGSKGLLRGAYQFYDYRYAADKQANKFIEIIGGDWGELPPVIDVEQPVEFKKNEVGVWKATPVPFPPSDAWKSAILNWISIIQKASGKTPIIYTNQNCIRYGLKMTAASPLVQYPLWVAAYQVPPVSPAFWPWPTWTFWQWGTPPVGLQYGMESRDLDCNLFNGDYDALAKMCGTVIPKPLTLEERVARLEKLHNLV